MDRCLRQMCVRFPIVIDEMAIMPDHVHLCIRVKEALGRSILSVLSGMRRVAEKEAFALEGRYATLWERKYRVFWHVRMRVMGDALSTQRRIRGGGG